VSNGRNVCRHVPQKSIGTLEEIKPHFLIPINAEISHSCKIFPLFFPENLRSPKINFVHLIQLGRQALYVESYYVSDVGKGRFA